MSRGFSVRPVAFDRRLRASLKLRSAVIAYARAYAKRGAESTLKEGRAFTAAFRRYVELYRRRTP